MYGGGARRFGHPGARLVSCAHHLAACFLSSLAPRTCGRYWAGEELLLTDWKTACEENDVLMPFTVKAVVVLLCWPLTTSPGEVKEPGPWKVNTAAFPVTLAWNEPSTPVEIRTGLSNELVVNSVDTVALVIVGPGSLTELVINSVDTVVMVISAPGSATELVINTVDTVVLVRPPTTVVLVTRIEEIVVLVTKTGEIVVLVIRNEEIVEMLLVSVSTTVLVNNVEETVELVFVNVVGCVPSRVPKMESALMLMPAAVVPV